ncbi:L,D-transpeptidase family protein [Streptomyces halobius]|uniref:L,D-transpeptidase family protein n=1 Tax=Streptomyces halobius TaxID=2879846 RepID=A0ABY4M6Q8_9ACTN|nr:L,D-transpeptidase family protein [Streptomyces halobius]UQA93455.1 L,D-transpeptidase family protein [Streptomyces halobius]
MRRGSGRPAAGTALLVAVAWAVMVMVAVVGCRPVTVTGAGAPDGTTSRQAPAADTAHTPPATTKPAPPTKHARPHRPAQPVMAYGSQGAKVRELQARLAQLDLFDRSPTGYYASVTSAAVRAFQKQQGEPRTGAVQPSTWKALLARTRQPSRSELYPPTTKPLDTPDPRCMRGRVICISKKSNTLAWMVDGKIVSAMDVRFGSQYSPTREGTFPITFKSRHHVSTIYHSAMPYAMFFSGGQAIHYSKDFAARGYAGASHGCVNVRDERKIAAVFAQAGKGTKVVIYH